MLALIGHNALFSYLTRLHKYGYVCPLHSFCEKEKYDKDECYDEPWNGKMCPMTIMGDVIHIKAFVCSVKIPNQSSKGRSHIMGKARHKLAVGFFCLPYS